MKKHIPNALTLLNLFFGGMGIIAVFGTRPEQAAWFLGIAALFDFFDGFVARWLKAYSELGKQLDSLADMVSFGVLPGMVLFRLMVDSYTISNLDGISGLMPYAALLFPLAAAVRLGKFNLDTRQVSSFLGLPTPAASLFVAALILQGGPMAQNPVGLWVAALLKNYWSIFAIEMVLCVLMVSELPLFALKFKQFGLGQNKAQYILLASALVLFAFTGLTAVLLVVLLYVLLSVLMRPKTAK